MLFVTDGVHDCPLDNEINIDDIGIQNMIIENKVRVVTIAFSDTADPNLENLATISNGKTYFIPDGK